MGVGDGESRRNLGVGWGGGGVRDIIAIYIRSYKTISYIIFIIQKPIQM